MNNYKKSPLVIALHVALALGVSQTTNAQSFPAEIELSGLDDSSGLILGGITSSARFGYSVSQAGDINGDGLDDLLVGAPSFYTGTGLTYLVFGSENNVDIFFLVGEDFADQSGYSVSAAGDINDDGFDDLIIGAPSADAGIDTRAGLSYVVFGSDVGLATTTELNTLDGSNGFVLNGEEPFDLSGDSVSNAGDINADGIDDIIIGAFGADPNGESSGRSYIVFGSASGFSNPFELSTLDGSNGFIVDGETINDRLGYSVSEAGDFNGDGIDDLIIGANRASPNGDNSGRSYILFGSNTGFPSLFDLGSLNGSNGLAINGETIDDLSGFSVSGAGDINDDGFDDVIIGAIRSDPNSGGNAGRTYVVFGANSGLPNPLNLSSLNGSNGFVLNGEATNDYSGTSVSAAGDFNGDGIDDLIIGAPEADINGDESGRSYVVFGSTGGFSSSIDLSTLNGLNGFAMNGEAAGDYSGHSVSTAGDINGDGIDDLIIGAYGAESKYASGDGKSYIVFGRSSNDLAISKTNGAGFIQSGIPSTWFIEVSNLGSTLMNDALVTDHVPADTINASWICSGSGGAVCPNASGTDGINEIVDLPPSSSLLYEFTATVTVNEPAIITNIATVMLADGLIDINPANNSATDSDPVGLFADGFENEY